MLDVQKRFSEIREQYAKDAKQETFNALICGESGSGKTHILHTARKPVLVHSFDPGGTKGLKQWIDKGEIMVDTRFEEEDPEKPRAYETWAREVNKMFTEGLFSNLGTYVLDSSTMWSEAIMNYILGKAGRAGQPPSWEKDYNPQKVMVKNHLLKLLSLPCDFILTGHLQADKDEVTGKVTYRYMSTGKSTTLIPLLFDEIYVTLAEDRGREVYYQLLTAGAGKFLARSRLASNGKILPYEAPSIKAILEKAGYDTKDKPLFK